MPGRSASALVVTSPAMQPRLSAEPLSEVPLDLLLCESPAFAKILPTFFDQLANAKMVLNVGKRAVVWQTVEDLLGDLLRLWHLAPPTKILVRTRENRSG